VLFVGDVEVESIWEGNVTPGTYMSGVGYTGGSFSSSKDLTVRAKFALWDNMNGVLVTHGFVEAVDSNTFAVSKDDWLAAMGLLVSKMFSGSVLSTGF
jgi:hypothetical protein